jgi:putative chitinase
MKFDRGKYFDAVRARPFGGSLTQEQVDGQEALLAAWEAAPLDDDLRWLAYALATTKHETASTMQPIEEYGKGAGQPYGVPDPETGQTYYGRGYVQLTWRENYAKATDKLGLEGADDLEAHADRALDSAIAAKVLFHGMAEGWFRPPHDLAEFFDDDVDDPVDDPVGAREIVNGDKSVVPDWSDGKSIGELVAGYHADFLAALETSVIRAPASEPIEVTITIQVEAPPGVAVHVTVVEG